MTRAPGPATAAARSSHSGGLQTARGDQDVMLGQVDLLETTASHRHPGLEPELGDCGPEEGDPALPRLDQMDREVVDQESQDQPWKPRARTHVHDALPGGQDRDQGNRVCQELVGDPLGIVGTHQVHGLGPLQEQVHERAQRLLAPGVPGHPHQLRKRGAARPVDFLRGAFHVKRFRGRPVVQPVARPRQRRFRAAPIRSMTGVSARRSPGMR